MLYRKQSVEIYNTMDTVIVGQTLGETSLAAMGAAASVYDLLMEVKG